MIFKALFTPEFRLTSARLVLCLPQRGHWKSWRDARVSSYEMLQPVEPLWLEHMHERHNFIGLVQQAKIDLSNKRAVRCLIVLPKTNQVIGGINLSRLEWGAKRAGLLSYWLTTSYQNQGYMREALQTMISYAFEDLRLNRLEAEVLAGNGASLRLLKRLEFRHEGQSTKSIKIVGKWRDHERYALINPNQD